MLEQEPEAIEEGVRALIETEEIINPSFVDFLGSDKQGGVSEPQDTYEISNQKEVFEADQEPLSTDNRQLTTDNHSAIYLAPFYYAELGVANQFLRLLSYSDQNFSHGKQKCHHLSIPQS